MYRPRFGAITHDDGVSFRVWAPAQRNVSLVLNSGDEIPMHRQDDGFFTVDVPAARAAQRYWYQLAQGLRPDPASRFQPEGPLGPSEIVDPRSFQWTDTHWSGAGPVHRHIFYEMHVGTFTEEGTWRAAACRLPSLVDIGITTLEIMPLAEFDGRFGWGYDGVNLFAPTRLYGAPDDVRAFVNEAHRLGLAVIVDVVYNHFGPVGNFTKEFSPTFQGPAGDWGDSINYDAPGSEPVRAFMIDNAAHWIAEYHVDGLRLDATHAIHDTSKDHIVSAICHAARAAAGSRSLVLVGESEPQDVRLLRRSGVYDDGLDALWCEDWHHSAFVALTGRREAYFTDYQGTAPEFASMARHGFLYQGQWYSWHTAPRGHDALKLTADAYVKFLENHDQVANTGTGERLFHVVDRARWRALTALLILGPGLPLIFQGQEFGSSKPFTYFADHHGELGDAVRSGRLEFLKQFPGFANHAMSDRLPDPADEQSYRACKLSDDERRVNTTSRKLFRDLVHLRRFDPVLERLGTDDLQIEASAPTDAVLLIRYLANTGHRLLVVNLADDHLSPMNDPLFAPPPRTRWTALWSSEHPDYGGAGAVAFAQAGRWLIRANSATLLTADAGGDS